MKCNHVDSSSITDFSCLVENFPSVLKEHDASAFFMESDIEFKNK